MLDENEYKRWIDAASATLDSARGDMARGDYNWACFKAQQAAELALKGLLYGIGSPRTGHSLTLLIEKLRDAGIDAPANIARCASLLDKMYIPTRYPDAWSEGAPHIYYTEEDARDAIACAEEIIAWVSNTWENLRG